MLLAIFVKSYQKYNNTLKNFSALVLLFTANTISGFSQGACMIAIPWYFVDTLQAPELFGKIYFFVTFVSIFWGPFAGTLVDKYNRKYLFLAENVFGAFMFLSIAAYGFYNGHIPTPLVAICFAATFFVYNLHYPTLFAFAQEIIEEKYYGKISTWLEVQGQFTSMISGAIAAVLLSGVVKGPTQFLGLDINIPFSIEAWSLQKIFLMDGITYTISFVLISFMSFVPTVIRKKEAGNVIKQFKIGITFLKDNPMIFVFGNAAYFIFVTIMVTNYMVMPEHIKTALNGDGNDFALCEMFYALGALGAGLSARLLFKRTTSVAGNIVLTILGAFTLIGIGLASKLWMVYILLFFLAVSNSGSRIMRVIYMFKHVPNQVIGRTQSVFQFINFILRLLFIGLFSLVYFTERTYLDFYILGVCSFIAGFILIHYYKRIVNVKVTLPVKTS